MCAEEGMGEANAESKQFMNQGVEFEVEVTDGITSVLRAGARQ